MVHELGGNAAFGPCQMACDHIAFLQSVTELCGTGAPQERAEGWCMICE